MASRKKPMPKTRQGEKFCLMVCGASGTGRTTFVNTLCSAPILPHKDDDDLNRTQNEAGLKIKPYLDIPILYKTTEQECEGTSVPVDDIVRLALTIVDTPGFGDDMDNDTSFAEIVGYLERQYDSILAEESRIRRNPNCPDNRVHAMLYFITPTGHGLRELDIEVMKRMAPRVNVIPVIGRSDSLTPGELAESKKLIMEDIEHYRIPVYNFPYDIEVDDDSVIDDNTNLRSLMPFAVVGSEDTIMEKVKMNKDYKEVPKPVRQYPWGVVDVVNRNHSDFFWVRDALFRSHREDLKQITTDFLYENYRTEKLSKSMDGGGLGPDFSMNPEDLASQSVRLKEEQLRREEEKLREIEIRVQREINEKRQELLARESQLREIEARMQREVSLQAPISAPSAPVSISADANGDHE